MEHIQYNIVSLTGDEAKTVCRVGKGGECCAYIVMGTEGFECIKEHSAIAYVINKRLREGTMHAKGTGGWEGCAWPDKKESV